MNKFLIVAGIAAIVGAFMGIKEIIQKFGMTAIMVGVFCISVVYGMGRLYSYGVEHKNG